MGCKFCEMFDFSRAKAEVNKYGAHIVTNCGFNPYDKKEQFNFCPVCGKPLKEDKILG